MISVGRIYFLERPWYAGSAGLAIFLVVLAFNLLGDAVRRHDLLYSTRILKKTGLRLAS